MRTTVTLDPDVATELERIRRRRGGTFKQILNEALREGLNQLERPAAATAIRTRAVSLGRPLVGSLDDVAHVLEVAEREDYR